ncbi:MAG: hypothetical protein AAFX87_17715 [Bacteroidota bacterium]
MELITPAFGIVSLILSIVFYLTVIIGVWIIVLNVIKGRKNSEEILQVLKRIEKSGSNSV